MYSGSFGKRCFRSSTTCFAFIRIVIYWLFICYRKRSCSFSGCEDYVNRMQNKTNLFVFYAVAQLIFLFPGAKIQKRYIATMYFIIKIIKNESFCFEITLL